MTNQKTQTGQIDLKQQQTRPNYVLFINSTGKDTQTKWLVGKRYITQIESKNKQRIAILISDKADFKLKTAKRDKAIIIYW